MSDHPRTDAFFLELHARRPDAYGEIALETSSFLCRMETEAAAYKDAAECRMRERDDALRQLSDGTRLRAHIDSLFESGNEVPVERITLSAATWEVIKDYLNHRLPLDFDRIEIERIYRSKTAMGLNAYSPLQAALAASETSK